LVNGLLGCLLRTHYPGMVLVNGELVAATTFEHYTLVPDQRDTQNRVFRNKADRVKAELWVSVQFITFVAYLTHNMNENVASCLLQDFYTCKPGFESLAEDVTTRRCRLIMKDLFDSARIQAIINYHALVLHERVDKKTARTMTLTAEQYMDVSTKLS
jgi:hypothetical protein